MVEGDEKASLPITLWGQRGGLGLHGDYLCLVNRPSAHHLAAVCPASEPPLAGLLPMWVQFHIGGGKHKSGKGS